MKAPTDEEQPGPTTRLEYRLWEVRSNQTIQTSVGPEYNVIFIRIIPTLKEVEKQMSSFNVNIPSERSENIFQQVLSTFKKKNNAIIYNKAHWTVVSQNDDFLTLTLY